MSSASIIPLIIKPSKSSTTVIKIYKNKVGFRDEDRVSLRRI